MKLLVQESLLLQYIVVLQSNVIRILLFVTTKLNFIIGLLQSSRFNKRIL